MSQRETYNKEEIRARISVVELYEREVGPLKRAGANHVGLCPFHEERTGSFTVHGKEGDEAKCYGCGWSGDIFDFWAGIRGVSFVDALKQLGGLTGVSPRVEGVDWAEEKKKEERRKRRKQQATEWIKPPIPQLDKPTAEELEQLAAVRGLQTGGLELAVAAGRLWCCEWPQTFRRGQWHPVEEVDGSCRAWAITDQERWVIQYRRFDGKPFHPIWHGEPSNPRKTWSSKNPSWPVGAAELGQCGRVLFMEGGADMLAAYHFLWGHGLHDVAVCCIFGAANPIADRARDFFRGRRVKIVMDADKPKKHPKTGRVTCAGRDAALRWQNQLTEAGAAVTAYDLEGLVQANGEPVKDLNDLALATADTLTSDEVWPLFFDWDF